MDFIIVIPARYGSTRLPGKPLLEVNHKPIIQWVYECGLASNARRVIVATDDQRIGAAVDGFNGEVCMTRGDHDSGSDRIAEVIDRLAIAENCVVVNLQGDEPAMPAVLINQVAATLTGNKDAVMATACHRMDSMAEFSNPNVVKVVRNESGMALYFSRASIPWGGAGPGATNAYRHIGIYAYTAGYLTRFTRYPRSTLEQTEQLEQLRVLESGGKIAVCDALETPGPGIDTLADLQNFRTSVAES